MPLFVPSFNLPNVSDESGLGDIAEEFDAVVNNGFGHAPHHVTLSEIGKLADFDDIRNDA